MTPEAKELFEAWVKEFSGPRRHISEGTVRNLGYPAFERGWEKGYAAGKVAGKIELLDYILGPEVVRGYYG